MKNIRFIEQTTSTYGRGKDKNKRKKRIITAIGGAVGGVLGKVGAEQQYAKNMYKVFLKNEKPTAINVNAVRKNLLKYKPGTGSVNADAIKKSFNVMRTIGGVRGVIIGASLASAALGAREAYKRLKNRKTVKIGKKTLVYNPPT